MHSILSSIIVFILGVVITFIDPINDPKEFNENYFNTVVWIEEQDSELKKWTK